MVEAARACVCVLAVALHNAVNLVLDSSCLDADLPPLLTAATPQVHPKGGAG